MALGERLFFDPSLSKSGETSCASCHQPERMWSDGTGKTSRADDGKRGRRNAPSLINSAGLPAILWDGSLTSLEQQATQPWIRGEMGITLSEAERRLRSSPDYTTLFRAHLGREPSAEAMAQALATFQRTLISSATRLERYLRGDTQLLSPIERDGWQIFRGRGGCVTCHTPNPEFRRGAPLQLSDFRFHNTGIRGGGRPDRGRAEHTRKLADTGAFRTPALRNLTLTAPYMHDGSIATLEEVVEFYDRGGKDNRWLSPLLRPLGLTPYEKNALVAFLRTLDDPIGVDAPCEAPYVGSVQQKPGKTGGCHVTGSTKREQ